MIRDFLTVPMRELSGVYDTPFGALNRTGQNGGNGDEPHSYDVLDAYESVPPVEETNNQPCTATTEYDATYSMVGPETDSSEQTATATVEATSYMHYEMVVAISHSPTRYYQFVLVYFASRKYLRYTRLQ